MLYTITDKEKCQSKGYNFEDISWYIPIPEKFTEADNYHLVDQHANYAYQITFFILNILWMTSSILLTCGGLRNNFLTHISWFILGTMNFLLDTIVVSLYISFYIEVIPVWRQGVTIFIWIVFFSRGFVFYIFNVVAIIIAVVASLETFGNESRKRHREERMQQTVFEMTSIATSSSQPTNTNFDTFNQQNAYNHNILSSESEHKESSHSAGPSKFSDFEKFQSDSYTNPGFEPCDQTYEEIHFPSDPTAPSINDYEVECDDEMPR
ncbi:hypothetical protein Avbf_08154 [Armadillidium vulgare]|nr:hypothetical protein Avbf_08154 [Armadillidium vulgare]